MSSRVEEKEQRRAERIARETADARKTSQRKRMKLLGAVFAAAAIVLIAAIVLSQRGSTDSKAGERDANGVTGAGEATKLLSGIPQNNLTLGDPKAPYTLVEYADLQCPFCRDYGLQVLPDIIERYVKPGKLKLELRLLRILGDDSNRASAAALVAADQNKLWNFTDLFYRNQGEEGSGYATEAFITKIGSAVPGLDGAQLVARSSDQTIEDRLGAFDVAAQTAGIQATPSFLLGKTGSTLQEIKPKALTVDAFTDPIDQVVGGAK